ncbi:Hypothetical predicted protein [Mytilus galloprovincialis]|uniref:Uncharacterized protein n=1 Tax=Mytilus galloprovincialis TaxID=29158 RepID=A0A8B6H9Q5_MYTGA|nr:Hypothetical predicted protein [Mytilus galloprovincialis]
MAVDAQGESCRSLFTKLIVNIPPVNIVALVNMFISDRGFLDKILLTIETWQEGPFQFDRSPFILAVATPCKVICLLRPKERQARLHNIVKNVFPKVMQQIFKECVSPRGLQGKYKQKFITIDFTANEISLMVRLPNIDDFSIELCYKILRYENVFSEPSCKWGNVPHDTEMLKSALKFREYLMQQMTLSVGSPRKYHSYITKSFKKNRECVLKRVDSVSLSRYFYTIVPNNSEL